jgi:hypothetical protein
VKGVAKAMLSSVTNIKSRRYEGAAFTSFFLDDAIGTTRKMYSGGSRRFLSYHCCKETRETDEERSHVFPHSLTTPKPLFCDVTTAA